MGRVCIDSGTVHEVVEGIVIRDRRRLSEHGFLVPVIAIDKHTGKTGDLPEIVSRGFVSAEKGSEIVPAARQVLAGTLESSYPEQRSDWGLMKEKIRTDLKRFIHTQTSRHHHAGDSGDLGGRGA